MDFFERLKRGIILFDGAMGTQIHDLNPGETEWAGHTGCVEILNLTIPDKIQQIHDNYLNAGADVIQTNTLGANSVVLAEFNLQHRVVEINRQAARLARNAADKYSTPAKPRFVAGDIGPGTKIASLGQTDYDTLFESYLRQAQGLLEGGVDLFIIETCQDPLQIKAALSAVDDALSTAQKKLPRIVSITIETSGTMLIGTDVAAALTILDPLAVDVLGINCATGPERMRPYVKQICQSFPGPVIVQPNAGMPEMINGETVYPLTIQEYVHVLSGFIEKYGVQIVGGCCGTTPDFIRALAEKIPSLAVTPRNPVIQPALASLYSSQELHQDPAPFFVGERANTNGSRKFRECLLKDDWDGVVNIAKQQEQTGAHGLDLCVAYTGRNEASDMHEAVTRIIRQVNLPIFIDSTDLSVIENALKLIGGRAVINSINLEDGEERVRQVCCLAKRFGAALIALTIDESGMAHDVETKLKIARRIYTIAVTQTGLRPQDLIFDTLTFTLGSGDESLKDAGANTIAGIKAIHNELPGVFTILGISNISFGLYPGSREILNSVFLDEAVKAGLDLAIVNVQKILPLYKIEPEDIDICRNLIYNRGNAPLLTFIRHFEKQSEAKKTEPATENVPLSEKIRQQVIQGNQVGLDSLLNEALKTMPAIDIINHWLIPAMKTVGDLFGAGKMQLPFVLQSAEVMKSAVSRLESYLEKRTDDAQTSIVLATVRGDVHDIGKNLVDIILTNNGYKVYNLGIKCEIETVLQKALQAKADAIGMSGLLVKSTTIMKENLELMRQRNITTPVLLGGAALTANFVADTCTPIYDGPVIYCPDAFAGLEAMNRIKAHGLKTSDSPHLSIPQKSTQPIRPKSAASQEKIRRDIDIPTPPFWQVRYVDNIDLDTVFSFLNEAVLFRGRWGYRRGKLSQEAYAELIEKQVRPEFEQLKKRCKTEKLLQPQIAYGYFQCNSDNEEVIIYENNTTTEIERLHFPRQKKAPYRSIADFFLPGEWGKRDLIALQVATVGPHAQTEAQRLFNADCYKDYLLFHGLSVESAEALAEYWHQQIRKELHIADEDGVSIADFVVQKYRGTRYSFGYPACPDLAENDKILRLLDAEKIGVSTTESHQMIPEQTTTAFIVHHPQAKYFTLE